MNPVVAVKALAPTAPADTAKGWREVIDELLKRWRQLGRIEVDLRGLVHLSVGVATAALMA